MILDFGERVLGRLLVVLVVNKQAADDPKPGRAITPALMRVIATQPR